MSYRDYNEETETVDFSVLKGKTLRLIENRGDELLFHTTDGETYRQIYYNDCCASCSVEEIHGNFDDLIGTPVLMAEEVSSREPDAALIEERKAAYEADVAKYGDDFYSSGPSPENGWAEDSETWTFYKAATIKGCVTIRWYGSSNGYYSESPTFERVISSPAGGGGK